MHGLGLCARCGASGPPRLRGASRVAALESPLARWGLFVQVTFYAMGALALGSLRVQRMLLPRLAGFFILVNASMLVAWFYHLSGQRSVQWQPTRR